MCKAHLLLKALEQKVQLYGFWDVSDGLELGDKHR
jgi:hypothetical protein